MNRNRRHSVDVVFVLMLFATFTISILMVLVMGTSSYNDVTRAMNTSYENRTGVAYVAEKVRHYSGQGSVTAGEFQGQSALKLTEYFDGEAYVTYLYYYDGKIRELFTQEGNDLPPEAGEAIIDATGLSAEIIGKDLIRVTCTMADGTSPYVVLNLKDRNASRGTVAVEPGSVTAGDAADGNPTAGSEKGGAADEQA